MLKQKRISIALGFTGLILSITNIFLLGKFHNYNCNNSALYNLLFSLSFSIIFFISFVITYGLLLYITLTGELKSKTEKSDKIENELMKNEPYIWYGKNVVGVVHNIKNKITPIYLLLNEIKDEECVRKDLKEFARNQINSSDSIMDLLNQLLLIIKNKNIEEVESVNINYLVLSVCEFFKANLEFKNNINLKILNTGNDLIINSKPFQLVQVIENIIKNSWDELKNKNYKKEILIEINYKEKYLSIKDNGEGISNCIKCKNKKCFYDCDEFKIGKTTKVNGLGYGMLFIENYIKENDLEGVVLSSNSGTEIKMFFK